MARARFAIAPLALFAVSLAAAGALLLALLADLTFWRDEWGFLLERRGLDPDVFLDPHYEHIAISLIGVYKGLLAIFGMDSPRPFQAASTLTFLLSVALLFIYARRRVGPWLALAASLPMPLGFYAAWWIWARQFDQGEIVLANITKLPGSAFDSLTAVLGSLTGLIGQDSIPLPSDRSSRPWQLELRSAGPSTVCGRPAA